MKILRRIAKFNKKEIPNEITLKSPKKERDSSGSFLDLFRPLRMAKQTLVQFYAWYIDCVLLFAIFQQLHGVLILLKRLYFSVFFILSCPFY